MATAGDGPDGGGGGGGERADPAALTDLAYVGEATAEVLENAGVTIGDVREKTVSYRQLVAVGVNPGVAGKLRREHSLHWTLDAQGADLDRRSKRVRGLRDGEREWVAATAGQRRRGGREHTASDDAVDDAGEEPDSADADREGEREWVDASGADRSNASRPDASNASGVDDSRTSGEADVGGDAFTAEAAWRERAWSPPVSSLPDVGRAEARRLEAVGVDTVRRLATADPEHLATRLGCSAERVRGWVAAARERAD